MVVQEYLFVRICIPDPFCAALDQTSICQLSLFPNNFNSDARRDLKPHQKHRYFPRNNS